jgi:hypothetical protein
MKTKIIKWVLFLILMGLLTILPYVGFIVSKLLALLGVLLLIVLFGLDFFNKIFTAIKNFFIKIKNFFIRK